MIDKAARLAAARKFHLLISQEIIRTETWCWHLEEILENDPTIYASIARMNVNDIMVQARRLRAAMIGVAGADLKHLETSEVEWLYSPEAMPANPGDGKELPF